MSFLSSPITARKLTLISPQIVDYRLLGSACRRGAWARTLLLLFWFRASLAPGVQPNARCVTLVLSAAQATRDPATLDQACHLVRAWRARM